GTPITESGVIGNGSGTVTFEGGNISITGSLTLSGNNTYTGGTSIINSTNSSTINLIASTSPGALGASGNILLSPSGGSTTHITLDLTALGSLTNTSGSIQLDGSSGFNLINTSAALTLSNPISLTGSTNHNAFSVAANTTTFTGAITG